MRERTLLMALAMLLVVVNFPAAASARDAFDGKWDVTITPEGGGKEIKDVFTFKGSQFTSQEFAKRGFAPSAYEEDSRGAGAVSATFKCTIKSSKPAEGTAEWTGTVTAVEMTGELKLTKPDGTVMNYTFKGTKQGS
jgi:hypothetical protein